MNQNKRPWRKILYEKQDYPDNYTDSSFLEGMEKNVHFHEVTYKKAFIGASLVTQEFCLVIFFIFSFVYMYNGWYSAEAVFTATSLLTLCGYLVYISIEAPSLRHLYDIVFYLFLGWLLSPVLQTLTATISTDTIYAMTAFMMTVHLIFFDYGVKVLIVSSSLSINATTFGSLCLASRLPTPFDTFVILTTAIESFVLCPIFFSKIGSKPVVPAIMVILCIIGLFSISFIMTIMFIGAVLFINVVCPILFVSWQRYKENIYGPWDEAVIPQIN